MDTKGMPTWITNSVNQTQRERDLHEALVVAWPALVQLSDGRNSAAIALYRIMRIGE